LSTIQRLQIWVSTYFFESASGDDNGTAQGKVRLSRSGQVAFGLLIMAFAGMAYANAWLQTGSQASRWQVCGQLRMGSTLQADYKQTLWMVDSLAAATQPQKYRLKQQLRELVVRLDGMCEVVIFYRSQESALLTVIVISLSLLSYAIAIGLPQGLANVQNRTLQVAIGTSGFLGMISVAFIRLGQQDVNIKVNHSNYRANHALLVDLRTSLANQQLTAGQSQPLNLVSSVAVAALIRSVDSRLALSPVFSFDLDQNAAMQMYERLTDGDAGKREPERPGEPASPEAAPAPAAMERAAPPGP